MSLLSNTGGAKRMDQALLGGSQQEKMRQWSSWGREAPPEHEEELLNSLLLYCTGTACPEKLWSLSPSLDIPEPSEHSFCAVCFGVTLLEQEVGPGWPFQPDPFWDSVRENANSDAWVCCCRQRWKTNNFKKHSLNRWVWVWEVRWQNFFPLVCLSCSL